jgi:hypothetical protein
MVTILFGTAVLDLAWTLTALLPAVGFVLGMVWSALALAAANQERRLSEAELKYCRDELKRLH